MYGKNLEPKKPNNILFLWVSNPSWTSSTSSPPLRLRTCPLFRVESDVWEGSLVQLKSWPIWFPFLPDSLSTKGSWKGVLLKVQMHWEKESLALSTSVGHRYLHWEVVFLPSKGRWKHTPSTSLLSEAASEHLNAALSNLCGTIILATPVTNCYQDERTNMALLIPAHQKLHFRKTGRKRSILKYHGRN